MNKIFASKQSGIAAIVEQGKEEKKNLYLKKCFYKESEEYSIIEEKEVMDYCKEFYVGRYNAIGKQWESFLASDRVNTLQTEAKRKDIITIPIFSDEKPGFFE
jgi:hypothetical protein